MTIISIEDKPKFPGDSIEVENSMLREEVSLDEAKEISLTFYQHETGFRGLAIPTLGDSILYSLKKGYYKNPQQVIDLLKEHALAHYEIAKSNFAYIFEDLKEQGFNI